MPPLSLLDRCVYWLLFLLLICLIFGLLLLFVWLRRRILLAEPQVVAEKGHGSGFWAAPFFLVLLTMGMTWWSAGYTKRKPLFGRKGVHYGPPDNPNVYPIFGKQRQPAGENQRKKRRAGAFLCLAALLLSALLLPLSIYGRDCLYADGTIVEYNMFNVQRASWQLSALEISVCDLRAYPAVGHSYGVRVTLETTGGARHRFTCADFRQGTEQGVSLWLLDMLALRAQAPMDRIRVQGTELLSQVIADRNLSEAEAALLYQLFAE